MNTPNLHRLAQACYNGACDPLGIIRSLGERTGEIPPGRVKPSVSFKNDLKGRALTSLDFGWSLFSGERTGARPIVSQGGLTPRR